MTKANVCVLTIMLATAAGCGGGSSSGGAESSGEGGSTPWVGQWSAVSQDGQPVNGDNCLITYTADRVNWNHCGVCETSGEVEINRQASPTVYDATATWTSTTCPFIEGRTSTYTMTFSDDFNTLEEHHYERDGAAFDQTNTWRRLN